MARLVDERLPLSVYIGRAGRGEDGFFGNPCVVDKWCDRCQRLHLNAESAVEGFRMYFAKRVVEDPEYRARVLALKDRSLWCPGRCKVFVPDGPCHGDVIVEWIESQ
jgi:hypothetical protein